MEASAPPSCAVRRWDSVWGLERPVDPSTREAEKRGGDTVNSVKCQRMFHKN